MNAPKNFALAFLALTTLGGALLAWRQYGELVELRAVAMNREERSDLNGRISDLERMNRELRDQLAALHGSESLDDVVADAATERPSGESNRERDRGRSGDSRGRGSDAGRQQASMAIRELMSKPEVQAMMSLQQKAAIEARYGALFRNLNLDAEQTEKLKTLLAERGNTRRDVEEAARAQGINPRENPEAYRKLVADAQDVLNANIKSVLGDQGFAQLQNYEQTMPQRALVDSLQQRLSHTMPLSPSQAEQLVQILASNTPQRTTTNPAASGQTTGGSSGSRGPGGSTDFGRGSFDVGRFGPMPFGGTPGGSSVIVTPNAVAQAQAVLAPAQVAVLQSIQQQQQAQQQLQQLIRETLVANSPPKSGNASAATASGSASTSGSAGSADKGRTNRPR